MKALELPIRRRESFSEPYLLHGRSSLAPDLPSSRLGEKSVLLFSGALPAPQPEHAIVVSWSPRANM